MSTEKEKYYTPKIEEFHVEFECEYLSYRGHSNPSWIDYTITLTDFNDLKKHNELELYRVKYLDKDDIEELGWIYSSDDKQWEMWTDTKLMYYGIKELNTIKKNRYFMFMQVADKQNTIPHPLFDGIIKNKSELKRIMKQLGI